MMKNVTKKIMKQSKPMKGLWLSLGLSLAMHSYAATLHTTRISDARIERVTYSLLTVVPIVGTVLTATQILFSRDEFIETVQCGDLGAWTVSINKDLPYTLFVKPTVYGSHTNLTVMTNQHTYYFALQSATENNTSPSNALVALAFIYPHPQPTRAKKPGCRRPNSAEMPEGPLSPFLNPAAYHWDYRFHGDKALMPVHVFDDGTFTYLQLQPHQPVPAVFAVMTPNGHESVVNVRQRGSYLVVQQRAPQFTLRAGNAVASLFNPSMIASER
jgi:type IV secretion system protein VirB9